MTQHLIKYLDMHEYYSLCVSKEVLVHPIKAVRNLDMSSFLLSEYFKHRAYANLMRNYKRIKCNTKWSWSKG